jgi:beta-galactosidase/beta-glucuronidase
MVNQAPMTNKFTFRNQSMKALWRIFIGVFFILAGALAPARGPAQEIAVALPSGVNAVWDIAKAAHATTPTRERICINGLWRWQPARADAAEVPAKNWGYFKVPGCWPGITDYMQKDSQTLFGHPSWKKENLAGTTMAWYQREIEIPGNWQGRRIVLASDYMNSFAAIYIDGKKVGQIQFPGGEADLTSVCHPGAKYALSLLVVALPLKEALLTYQDTNSARKLRATVPRRGLCGDVFLESTPNGPRINDVKVETSVRRGEIGLKTALVALKPDVQYTLLAEVTENGKPVRKFGSKQFNASELQEGRFAFTENWKPGKLWDTDTPANQFDVAVSLRESGDKVLDASEPLRFGFREFWIDGRDFYLNGTRIFLSAVPLDNAEIGAAASTYAAARESMERLKSFGVNFVYTHNYGCEPGSHLSFEEILRAADDVGMLVSMTQPHFSHYDWQKPDADENNGYARHAAFYVRVAEDHPSVVTYAMSHNATGYDEDMNPDLIDGIHAVRDQWAVNNVQRALRAEKIVERLDPTRIVYHHASGNLGSMHCSNFYPNFVPVQELSDWFEHWSIKGIKPMFTCEYGAPFTWDWAMYRGWYKGKREWGSAKVPWEFCLAEWDSQFLGDQAFKLSEAEKANLRWEAKQFRTTDGWFRWDYPQSLDSKVFDQRYEVMTQYLTDNWRAFRTWGVSAISSWQHEHYWKLRDGVDRRRKNLAVDWDKLQRPGYSPDYLDDQYERMDLAYERADWIPTPAAEAMYRNNMPLLAYIGGKSAGFTSKDHIFYPGEVFEKQLIVINNSRKTVDGLCKWSLGSKNNSPHPAWDPGSFDFELQTGEMMQDAMRMNLPETWEPGEYELKATTKFSTGETQEDRFSIHLVARPRAPQPGANIALFDPQGETAKLLLLAGVKVRPVGATDDISKFDTLIVGKDAITVDGPAPPITRVRDGLKVILFEQQPEVLEKRFGFRVQQYGLRQVFPRVADHPLLAGLSTESLRDWRGSSTLLPPQLKYEMWPMHGPKITWCDIPVTQAWRCGNRGNVASGLIEKPACGNFLPIVDGGFSLQYSPLMEYREGRGMILFCQLDVTGRTESEPAAETLLSNMLRYVAEWKPCPRRKAEYVGELAGKEYLESAGVSVSAYDGAALGDDIVLIVGPGGGRKLAAHAADIADWLKAGGHLLAIGIDQQGAAALLPFKVSIQNKEHIGAFFEPFNTASLLAGVGPADVQNRDPRNLPLVTNGATIIGDGVLAQAEQANVVFSALAPWQFDKRQYHLKKTFRRSAFLLSRLLGNMGVETSAPILARFSSPVAANKPEQRWLRGLYLDQPEEWDDPYRFFRW